MRESERILIFLSFWCISPTLVCAQRTLSDAMETLIVSLIIFAKSCVHTTKTNLGSSQISANLT